MKPSEWLRRLEPASLYAETKLAELERYGIKYDDGQVMSAIRAGHPYSTYGRLASVALVTPTQAIQKGRMMGLNLSKVGNDNRHEDPSIRFVFGFDIATAVWMVVHDITTETPPSKLVRDPSLKADLDIEAIERYGY